MRSLPVVRETLVRVGTCADEDRRRQWLRIVQLEVGARRRYRVDFTVGVPAAWSLSLDGFASLAEATSYAERTTRRVVWSTGTPLPAPAARDADDRYVAWYVGGGHRPAAEPVTVEMDDLVDAGSLVVEVDLGDLVDDDEPTPRAA